jgi:hypothetical protein
MKVYLEGISDEYVRTQPWETSVCDPRGRHYNFREQPELIREVLEDFKPYDKSVSIQKFYEMLEWINGPTSNFESSDCRLTGPAPNEQKEKFPWDVHAGGRLMVFFRDLKLNVTPVTEEWLYSRGQNNAPLYEPNQHIVWLATESKAILENRYQNQWWPILQLHYFPTFYKDIVGPEQDKFGYQLVYEFHSWSDTNEQMLDFDLLIIFDAVFQTLKALSANIDKSKS